MSSPTVTLRPPTPADAPAVWELSNRFSVERYGGPLFSLRQLESFWTAPDRDLQGEVLVAEDEAGQVIGYADLENEGGKFTHFFIALHVDEEQWSGTLPGQLFDELESRAERLADNAPSGDRVVIFAGGLFPEPKERLLHDRGYELVRHSFRMEIELDEHPAQPTWPEGIRVRSFAEGDERAVWEAHMESFRDSWAFAGHSFEEWKHYSLASDTDPSLLFLAEDGARIAGICLCRRSETDDGMGWVEVLGVRKAWRKRGLGQALLEHSFAEFYARGLKRAGLGVDAQSPTGATRLYERAGMVVKRQYEFFQKEIRAGRDPTAIDS